MGYKSSDTMTRPLCWCVASRRAGGRDNHLDLLRPQVGEGSGEQLRDMLMHEGRVVGEGSRAQRSCVPQRRLDHVGVDDCEQVVQDLGMHLQAWLVERVCTTTASDHRRQPMPI